jgi:hypothetical protein
MMVRLPSLGIDFAEYTICSATTIGNLFKWVQSLEEQIMLVIEDQETAICEAKLHGK